ncbi:MAG TPA: hypothetical protein VNJ50_14450, partial [Gelidibacter sp.]|uniref:hypothetical protein n=1 Tax=Gelidibacter sp. TaxID=2018083 RepID=UPI002B755EB1
HGRVLKRKSVGLAITKARLSNFSERFTTDYKLDIEDMYDKQGNSLGTKVSVYIPTKVNN